MIYYKKILIGTGTLVAAIAPVATAISCGNEKEQGPEHPIPDPDPENPTPNPE